MEGTRHKILVPADASRLCELRERLCILCEGERVPDQTTRLMVLAIDEALSNVIEHANLKEQNPGIELSLEIGTDKIVAEIHDRGPPFDPTQPRQEPDRFSLPRRGFGLYLIHKIVDEIEYERTGDGQNILTLTKTIG